ncbi:MAG: uroporphyrinogen decarboxylase family protein [Tannerella sp.]|jgi:uroporphyrinogen decarboxylase|nr:uroporphyrinogen decarboxylase family protein [Tannerella sp.]
MNLIKQLKESNKRLAIPVLTNLGIEAIGKTVYGAVTNGEVHYEAIKYLADTYDSAACTVIMDLTVEAEAFGAQIQMPENEIPSVIGRLVSDADSVDALMIPAYTAGRVPQYLEANRLAAENIKDKPVLSGCIGPYSLAGRLYDMSEIMVAIYIEPDTVNALLEKCTVFLIGYCKRLKATGTAGVLVAEPAAGLLSNDDSMEFSTKYVKKIVDAVQDDDFAVVLHNCGNTGESTPAMIASGANALHFGNKIDMSKVLKTVPSDIVVMGNIDPVGIFKQGKPEDVYSATGQLLEQTASFKNFVISSGCDIPPLVSQDNIKSFFNAVTDFNEKHG